MITSVMLHIFYLFTNLLLHLLYRSKEDSGNVKNSERIIEEESEFIVKNGTEEHSNREVNITRSLTKSFLGYFLGGSILKLVYDLLQFVNPVILG